LTRILIADDHAIVRRGLAEIIARDLKGALHSEAEHAQQVIDLVREQNWDLLILDITMPGRSGVDVLVDVKRMRPKLPVLILSMHPEDQFAKRALKAGAAGYITKGSAADELVHAIRRLLKGGRYVSTALAESLAQELADDSARPKHENLSHREFEVLRMIASGKTVSQIAAELHLTLTTISTYRARVLQKMNMSTSAELMHYAMRNRLVE
jgi:two-component system, NarL family, invasion response regulator UvrY